MKKLMLKKFFKFFFGILALAALVYLAGVAYSKWYLSGGISKAAGQMKNKGTSLLDQAKNAVVTGAESAIAKNIADLARWAGDNLRSLGESMAGTSSSPLLVGTTSAPLYNNQVVSLPSSTAGSFSIPPPPVSLLVHVGDELYFSLVSGGPYEIKWGDGSVEDGVGSGLNKVTVISHSWKNPGDYTIQITAGTPYSFPIRVLP